MRRKPRRLVPAVSLLRSSPDFRRLFLAHALSRAGDTLSTVALVVLTYQLTGSGLGVAGTVAFEVVPVLLLGPLVGVAADRLPRRSLMLGADLGRALLAAVLAVASGSLGLVYAVAFGLSAFTLVFNPAASSTVPDVVEPDELVAANSGLWTVAVLTQIVLAPLAGWLVASYGPSPAFALNALSFVTSAALLWSLRAGRTPAAVAHSGWQAALAGVEAVRAHPLLGRLAVVQVLAALSAGATSALLVVLAEEWLGFGPSGFGLLLSAIGLGAAAGPLIFGRFIRPADRRWLFGPYAVRGVVDLVLASPLGALLAAPALVAYGLATSSGMVAYQSTLQQEIDPDLRGRVFALFDILWNAARLASLAVGGLLADAVGVRIVYLLGGVLLLAAFALGYIPAGRLPRPRPPGPGGQSPRSTGRF